MNSYQEFKTFYSSNLILFIILLFVIIYLIINWENVYSGNYWIGEVVRPILITGIIFLIVHIILTWDDDVQISNDNLVIPKYKLGQTQAQAQVQAQAQTQGLTQAQAQAQAQGQAQGLAQGLAQAHTQAQYEIIAANTNLQNMNSNPINQSINSKYRIVNKFDTNPTLGQFSKLGQMGQNLSNTHTDNNLTNQNIFISQKNSGKYGIKFI